MLRQCSYNISVDEPRTLTDTDIMILYPENKHSIV